MSTRTRTVAERIGDWKQAYDSIAAELNPIDLKQLVGSMGTVLPQIKVPETPAEAETYAQAVAAAASLMSSSMKLAHEIAENQRVAATVAEALVRNGLDREKERDL